MTFGAGGPNEITLTAAGSADIFVAKYASDGTFLWATRAGGASSDTGTGIATDRRGRPYVTGFFQGMATFGPGEPKETTLTSVDGDDVFVANYDRDGTLLWATSAGGPGFDQGQGIATDPRCRAYVTGFFQATATFGAGEANETVLSSPGIFDVFVAKYRAPCALGS